MRAVIAVLIVLILLIAPCGAEERSPFERTPAADYEEAIKSCEVRGVVITKQFSRVILRCQGSAELLVYGQGEKLTVFSGGLEHEFRVRKIGRRSVSFQDKQGKIHEVEWQ